MNLAVLFVLISLSVLSEANLRKPLSLGFVDSVSGIRPLWTASSYGLPQDYDVNDLRRLASGSLDLTLPDSEHYALVPVTPYASSNKPIPKEFDAREAWPKCESIKEIRDQGRCGSCWAFATAEVMSDRICIHTGTSFQYSPEDLIENCRSCKANLLDVCGSGGYTVRAVQFWCNEGIVSGGDAGSLKGCKPYFSDAFSLGKDPVPTASCTNVKYQIPYKKDKHWGKNAFALMGVSQIQREIMENGPVVASYSVYEDFFSYSTGIYHHVSGNRVGGHAVKLIGWGENPTDGTPYWLVANSWGAAWGESGFFRILRGKDECGIESRVITGLPYKNESFFTTWIIEHIVNFFKFIFGGIFFY